MSCFIPEEERLNRDGITALQLRKFRGLAEAVRDNPFYAAKFARAGIDAAVVRTLEDFARLPFTTKAELSADQAAHPIYGSNLTYPLAEYTRVHQTSGTSGEPLRWLDTPESWAWFRKCWGMIYAAAGVHAADRLFFPFSFGPFIGFWAAFEGAQSQGYFCLSGGGMSTAARLEALLAHGISVVCCTPTYALHMADSAARLGMDLARSPVRALIVAGEPGGSVPAVRQRIETAWGARVFDHTGMTEIGSLGIECEESPGSVHLLENECIAEVIDGDAGRPVGSGEEGELVLTNLGRWGSPLIRYRTGDRVRLDRRPCRCGRGFARMQGGILGRTDDMLFIKGNNVYPATIENIVRCFPTIAEFRVTVRDVGGLQELELEIEPQPDSDGDARELAAALQRAIHDQLSFRPRVRLAAPGALPRFELKSRRFNREKS